ncbi:MAG: DUF1499 domain-containing protein [Sphingomonadaceae bacterium]|nr:DUF1499 domain-containing protein [Sphingomonadaceae bacterium]
MAMDDVTTAGTARWPRWIVYAGALFGAGGPILAIAMAVATGAGMLGWETSLGALRPLLFVSIAGFVLSLIGLIVIFFKKQPGAAKWAVLGAVLSTAFLIYAGIWINQMGSVPPIHDVTTDLTNPPEFEELSLRADNREIVPDGGRPELAAVDEAMRWRLWHAEAYSDIQPIIVPLSVPDTVEAARQLIEDRGWEIASVDPVAGRVEATEAVSLYRFKDDVVLRITPNPDGEGSVVNMRSVSRVGVSDLGVNADRIRAFLRDLSETTAS